MGCPWDVDGSPMCNPVRIARDLVARGDSMVLSWDFDDTPMQLERDSGGYPVDLP